MKTRILLVLAAMLAVTQAWALEGSGASNNPYKIGSLADWNDFVAEVKKHTTPDDYAIQTANISGVETIVENFNGFYDGQGYTIEVAISGAGNIGLFGTVNGATIQNVVVIGGSVKGTGSKVGSIVGELKAGTIQDCVNYANISTSYVGEARCGGIVGSMPSGGSKTVTRCTNFGHVEANRYVGGIVGSTGEGSITYCENYGTVVSTGTVEYSRRTGGIVGSRTTSTALTNNHNGGDVICAMGGSVQHHLIQGNTGDNVDASNTYLYNMTLIVDGTTYTKESLTQWASGATRVDVNPSGITINNKTYSGPANYTLNEADNNTETLNNLNGGMANVTLTRTLNPAGWNTFCAPFDISALQIASAFGAGTKVRTLGSSDYDSSTKTLTLNFTTAETIEAGKPYLVYIGSSTAVSNPTFTNVNVSNTITPETTDYVDFVPVMNPTTLTGGDKDVLFVVGGDKLTFPTTTDEINGFRAYFQLKDGTPASGARSFTMSFDDETTAISMTLKEDDETLNGLAPTYNLNGQRVAQPQRGLYIVNGKKTVVK